MLIASLIGLSASRFDPASVLRACAYLQGGILLILAIATHFMGMHVPAACVAAAGACYYAGAAGLRRRALLGAAAILFLVALAWMLALAPTRVDPLFALQQCGLAVGLAALANSTGRGAGTRIRTERQAPRTR